MTADDVAPGIVDGKCNALAIEQADEILRVQPFSKFGCVAAPLGDEILVLRRIDRLKVAPAGEMADRAISMSRTGARLTVHPILGRLPLVYTTPRGLPDKLRRSFGRMPWTTTQKRLPRPYSVPVGGMD